MAVYLGNQLIGNGLYLGNENYQDTNVFMSMSAPPAATYVTDGLVFYVDAGKGFRIGNRNSGENFLGLVKKFVAYNRPLSDPKLATIEAWMTGSN